MKKLSKCVSFFIAGAMMLAQLPMIASAEDMEGSLSISTDLGGRRGVITFEKSGYIQNAMFAQIDEYDAGGTVIDTRTVNLKDGRGYYNLWDDNGAYIVITVSLDKDGLEPAAQTQRITFEHVYIPDIFITELTNAQQRTFYADNGGQNEGSFEQSFQYIELYNYGSEAKDLADYTFVYTDTSEHEFELITEADGRTVIEPGEMYVIGVYSGDTAKLGYKYDTDEAIGGYWDAFNAFYSSDIPITNRSLIACVESGSTTAASGGITKLTRSSETGVTVTAELKKDGETVTKASLPEEAPYTSFTYQFMPGTGVEEELLFCSGPFPYKLLDEQRLDYCEDVYFSNEEPIKAMSYNVLATNDAGRTVKERFPLVMTTIENSGAEIIGMQEVNTYWVPYLTKKMPEYYSCVEGYSTYGNSYSSVSQLWDLMNPIYYRNDKYTLLDSGAAYLTPSGKGETQWDSVNMWRTMTWAVLQSKETNKIVSVVNGHLVLSGKQARIEQVRLMNNKANELCDQYGGGAIIMGDHNLTEGTEPYQEYINSGYVADAKYLTTNHNSANTYQEFGKYSSFYGVPIDFCFVTPEQYIVQKYDVLDGIYESGTASDHAAVYIELLDRETAISELSGEDYDTFTSKMTPVRTPEMFVVPEDEPTEEPTAYSFPSGIKYWSNTNGSGEKYIPGINYILEASAAQKSSGERSLHLCAQTELANVQIRVGIPLNEPLAAGNKYHVTGKAVRMSEYGVNAWWDCIHLQYGSDLQSLTDVGTVVCGDDNTFLDFGFDITPSNEATMLAFYTWQGNYYIDELSCRLDNGDGTYGDELVINGGFEEYINENINVRLSDADYPASWLCVYNGANTDYMTNCFMRSTSIDAFEGERSLLVNIPTETANVQMDLVTHFTENAVSGKKYRLEYWTKVISGGEVGTAIFGRANTGDTWLWYVFNFSAGRGADENGIAEKDGWYHKYYDFTMNSDAERMLFRQWAETTALFDNFKLREIKDDGTFGENILTNGGFEDYVNFASEPTDELYNANWTSGAMGVEDPSQDDYLRFADKGGGDYAMHINYDDLSAANTYAVVELANAITLPKGSYTLEYDSKLYAEATGDTPILSLEEYFWSGTNRWNFIYPKSFATSYTETDGGWTHIKKEFTVSEQTTTKMQFILSGPVDMLIDNITIKDSGNVEYVPDGGFDGCKEYNTTELENVVVYPVKAGGAVTVSWTNPHAAISGMAVSVNGTDINAAVNAAADAYNEVYIGDLVPGTEYNVTVRAAINGEEKSYTDTVSVLDTANAPSTEMDYRTGGIGDYNSSVWSTFIRDGEGYANTVADVENGSAVLRGNIPNIKGNTYVGIEQTVDALDGMNLYKLKFRAKSDSYTTLYAVCDARGSFGNAEMYFVRRLVSLTPDWTEYEVVFDSDAIYSEMGDVPEYAARYLLFTENYTGKLYIDDVELYAVNPDNYEPEGENLISDSSFDTAGAPAVIGDTVFKDADGNVITSLKQGMMEACVDTENAGELAMIIAVYKDGALYSTSALKKTAAGSESYRTSFTISDISDGVYTAKVMYWNNLNDMKPLRNTGYIEE